MHKAQTFGALLPKRSAAGCRQIFHRQCGQQRPPQWQYSHAVYCTAGRLLASMSCSSVRELPRSWIASTVAVTSSGGRVDASPSSLHSHTGSGEGPGSGSQLLAVPGGCMHMPCMAASVAAGVSSLQGSFSSSFAKPFPKYCTHPTKHQPRPPRPPTHPGHPPVLISHEASQGV